MHINGASFIKQYGTLCPDASHSIFFHFTKGKDVMTYSWAGARDLKTTDLKSQNW